MSEGRIVWVDIARTLALVGMVIFHFVTDLAIFLYIPIETPMTGGWAVFARLVAGSFLFIAGLSLVLAHGSGIRWGAFLRRFAIIAGAAGLVTLGTWLALPEAFIFFGILHSIAAASLIGLMFLRLPAWLTAAAAIFAFVAPEIFSDPAFNVPWFYWLGLSTEVRPTIDYLPVLPWLSPALLGVALGRLAADHDLWRHLPAPPPRAGALAWPGRHSLAIYLIHQPILIGAIWAVTQIIR